jgi:sulfur relay (sulfurtransferase) complex TusBCD TusD component (DsrE family)
MKRKKLIFFTAADPAADALTVSAAYRFAEAAAAAGVEAEVRLAGDAVLIADPVYVATLQGSATLRGRIDGAVKDRIDVSVCPRSVQARGIRQEQVAAIGAYPRPLADILVEVAEGRSVLVNV